jgi:hypothetical protein
MKQHQTRYAFKHDLSPEDQRLFALKYTVDDNYKTNPGKLAQVYELVRWKPFLDMCSNVIGSNSTAPFYYDPMSEARE